MYYLDITCLLISCLFIVFVKCMDKNPAPRFGIYERKDGRYFLKVIFFYVILTIIGFKRRLSNLRKKFRPLEKTQTLSFSQKNIDVISLEGSDKYGDSVILKVTRRNSKQTGYMFLKIGESKFKASISLDPYVDKNEDYGETFSTDDLKLNIIEPLKAWRVTYRGEMADCDHNISKTHKVEVQGIWITDIPVFHFEDADALNFAKRLAYEKWNRDHFLNLKRSKATHYEQFGTLLVKVKIDDQVHKLKIDTIKSRYLGHDNMSYVWKECVHRFIIDGRDCFTLRHTCNPIVTSRMIEGFVYSSKENKTYPIQSSSLQLYKFGGIKDPPQDYGFTIRAGKTDYQIQVKVTDTSQVSTEESRNITTYFQTNTVEVNGINGWGISKWLYQNIE
ncbi:uncharacterized protein LOC126880564 isoform X1 [Diabrotica virgifera virgifera]|uniref:Uncharacterized protein n=1 Tax=Diabrotica virgifera virgifera TaxID=50390 RepID=A0ABM5JRA4_DIAVI|nr:uncharacterized protein LOC126880564 isoform X1 [Diabrotica virgifera virgifera]